VRGADRDRGVCCEMSAPDILRGGSAGRGAGGDEVASASDIERGGNGGGEVVSVECLRSIDAATITGSDAEIASSECFRVITLPEGPPVGRCGFRANDAFASTPVGCFCATGGNATFLGGSVGVVLPAVAGGDASAAAAAVVVVVGVVVSGLGGFFGGSV